MNTDGSEDGKGKALVEFCHKFRSGHANRSITVFCGFSWGYQLSKLLPERTVLLKIITWTNLISLVTAMRITTELLPYRK
jgi:hypothetical protein